MSGTPAGGVMQQPHPFTWSIDTAVASHFRLLQDNVTVVKEGTVPADGKTFRLDVSPDRPGWLYLELTQTAGRIPVLATSAGVLVQPQELRTRAPRPADFDAFWKGQIDALQRVPANPKVVRIDSGRSGVKLYELTLDNLDGTKVRAQIARPSRGTNLPAVVIYQWAGVYALQKEAVTDLAAEGWLAVNVMPHDLPMYEKRSFYEAQAAGPLKNYATFGNTSRETSYFRRMLLADYRALDYVCGRDDWNGRTLVVRGESQGGMQSFAMAGLHPKVSAMIATRPAGIDVRSDTLSWPNWPVMPPDDRRAEILTTADYFDAAHFAANVTCPALVVYGLRDVTAPPRNVLTAVNVLKGPHEVIAMPDATHQGDQEASISAAARWMATIHNGGNPVPATP